MRKKNILLIIILAFASLGFRAPELIRNPYRVSYDSFAYYNTAVNLLRGNGYSMATEDPYEPYFWREPAYSVFLSACLSVPSLIGFRPAYMVQDESVDPANAIGMSHSIPMWEKLYLKVLQAILDAFTVLLIFYLLTRYFTPRHAFWSCILMSFFTAFIGVYAMLLRETLQLFLMVLLTIAMYRYFEKPKRKHPYFIGLILGMLALILQLNLALSAVIVVHIMVFSQNKWKAIFDSIKIVTICMLLVIPWVARSYMYAGDWRVVKTMGSSLTFEQIRYFKTVSAARRIGVIDEQVSRGLSLKYVHGISDKQKFEYAYSGRYSDMSDSLRLLIDDKNMPVTTSSQRSFIKSKFLKRFIFLLTPRVSFGGIYSGFKTALFGILALIAILPIVRLTPRLRFIWPMILFHLIIFYPFGDESRRLIYMHYYVAVMASIAIVHVTCRRCFK